MEKGILDRLAAGPVVGDGGYLLELEKRGYVRAGPFTPGFRSRTPKRSSRCTESSSGRAPTLCGP